jgi:hypothetical protein
MCFDDEQTHHDCVDQAEDREEDLPNIGIIGIDDPAERQRVGGMASEIEQALGPQHDEKRST